MKSLVQMLKITLLAVIFFITQQSSGCKDPKDFKPPDDTLENPPPAPVLLTPMDSFVYMAEDYVHSCELRWEPVESAQLYQLEFVRVGVISDTIDMETTCYARNMLYPDYGYYQWRVRASHLDWFFTSWSEVRQFEIRWLPAAPFLCTPPDDTIFFLDSGLVFVQFAWARTSDEETYEIRVYTDLYSVYEDVIFDTTYTFEFAEVDRYYWQVRAGSRYWERPTDWSSSWSFAVR